MAKCKLCLRPTTVDEPLCKRHRAIYVFEPNLKGFRLKKINNGSNTRHVRKKFHSHEIELTKILERYYGVQDIVTGFHPLWAVSEKGVLLEFDILIRSKKILIEYNGEQHYKFIRLFHKRLKRFEDQKKRDILKETLAKANNYKLVVFKFDEPLVEDFIIMKIGTSYVKKEEKSNVRL